MRLSKQLNFTFVRPYLDDDDDEDYGGGFEMELANMDLDGGERMIGDGPENQQTCVKWVNFFDEIANRTVMQIAVIFHGRPDQIHRTSIPLSKIWYFSKSMLKII